MKPSLRPKPADALVGLAVMLLGAALIFSAPDSGQSGQLTAVTSIDGQVTESVRLSTLKSSETRTLTANGYTLTLILSPDGAEIAHADCPTQDCVHTGKITRPGQSIVCLPARISVVLEGSGDGGVDAVLG